MQEKTKIKSFTDLKAWQESHNIVIRIYKITKNFPKEEVFGLTNQMRRCAVSVTSNIAEGFSRSSKKDKSQFYTIALGSVTGLQSQLLVAKDIQYISKQEFKQIADKTVEINKMINGLIKSNNNNKNSKR
jgi:four helix bundle protein